MPWDVSVISAAGESFSCAKTTASKKKNQSRFPSIKQTQIIISEIRNINKNKMETKCHSPRHLLMKHAKGARRSVNNSERKFSLTTKAINTSMPFNKYTLVPEVNKTHQLLLRLSHYYISAYRPFHYKKTYYKMIAVQSYLAGTVDFDFKV